MATQPKKNSAQDALNKALATAEAEKTKKAAPRASKEEILAATKKNALPYRVMAFIFWILALGSEVMAILIFAKKIDFPTITTTAESMYPTGWWIFWIGFLVLDLIFLIIGSACWKKGNHLDPASAKNKTRFWLHNNLGIFVAALCFIPFIIIALTDKNADKKAKTWAAIIAAIALALGVTTSIDYNPISQEEMLNNVANYSETYWLAKGEVFHIYQDCQYIRGKDYSTTPSEDAVKSGKTRLCKVCEKKIHDNPDVKPANMLEEKWEEMKKSTTEANNSAQPANDATKSDELKVD